METLLFGISGAVWLVLEISLLARDRARGMGSTAKDHGTRSLTIALVLAGIAAADALANVAGPRSPLRIPGHPWIGLAGLVIVWAGLATRVWAVAELGHSFRTTVEVEADQAVVSSGPYRLIRHPSYTGILLISAGFGLGFHSWPGLALCVMLPLVSALRRIRVEEAELTSVLGEPYRAYVEHTKRLFPGVW